MPKEEIEKVLTSIPALVKLIKFRRSLKTLVFIILECQEQSATKLKVELACSSVSSRVDFSNCCCLIAFPFHQKWPVAHIVIDRLYKIPCLRLST